jgi:hypothetical protein
MRNSAPASQSQQASGVGGHELNILGKSEQVFERNHNVSCCIGFMLGYALSGVALLRITEGAQWSRILIALIICGNALVWGCPYLVGGVSHKEPKRGALGNLFRSCLCIALSIVGYFLSLTWGLNP